MSTASHEAELTPQAAPGPTAQHPVRYAVVGAGWISQAAVLPASRTAATPSSPRW